MTIKKSLSMFRDIPSGFDNFKIIKNYTNWSI